LILKSVTAHTARNKKEVRPTRNKNVMSELVLTSWPVAQTGPKTKSISEKMTQRAKWSPEMHFSI